MKTDIINVNCNTTQKLSAHRGFTLVEVLVSLLLFSVGMLGVVYQMSRTMSNTINTEIHSSVMQIATHAVGPLESAVRIDTTSFLNALNKLSSKGSVATFASNTNKEKFNISVTSATNSNDNQLDVNDDTSWLPPYTVVLNIIYTGKNNVQLSFPTTHVFVPPVFK